MGMELDLQSKIHFKWRFFDFNYKFLNITLRADMQLFSQFVLNITFQFSFSEQLFGWTKNYVSFIEVIPVVYAPYINITFTAKPKPMILELSAEWWYGRTYYFGYVYDSDKLDANPKYNGEPLYRIDKFGHSGMEYSATIKDASGKMCPLELGLDLILTPRIGISFYLVLDFFMEIPMTLSLTMNLPETKGENLGMNTAIAPKHDSGYSVCSEEEPAGPPQSGKGWQITFWYGLTMDLTFTAAFDVGKLFDFETLKRTIDDWWGIKHKNDTVISVDVSQSQTWQPEAFQGMVLLKKRWMGSMPMFGPVHDKDNKVPGQLAMFPKDMKAGWLDQCGCRDVHWKKGDDCKIDGEICHPVRPWQCCSEVCVVGVSLGGKFANETKHYKFEDGVAASANGAVYRCRGHSAKSQANDGKRSYSKPQQKKAKGL